MLTLRRATERYHMQTSRLVVWRTFNPQTHPSSRSDDFGAMVVFDEIRLPPGEGTASHAGDELEVVTYMLKGALSQEDSTGHSGVIHAGEFQCMSAGHRIRRKETNASRRDWAHIFRISVRPSQAGLDVAYEQKRFTMAERCNVLCVVASADGRKGSLRIHHDAIIYSSVLDPGNHIVHELTPGHSAWLHVVSGQGILNDIVLTQGDGVGVSSESSVSLTVQEATEVLLVDLP